MTFFTDFLLQSARLTTAQLVEVEIAQLEATPPIAAVVFRERLLTPDEQHQVLRRQVLDGSSYRVACLACGLWTEELATTTQLALGKARPSLSSLLLERRYVDEAQLEVARAAAELQRLIIGTDPEVIRADYPHLEQVLLDEFSILFKPEDAQKLLDLSAKLPQTAADKRAASLRQIVEQCRYLQTGARFIAAQTLNTFLAKVIDLAHIMATHSLDLNNLELQLLHDGLDHFWQICPNYMQRVPTSLKRAG